MRKLHDARKSSALMSGQLKFNRLEKQTEVTTKEKTSIMHAFDETNIVAFETEWVKAKHSFSI